MSLLLASALAAKLVAAGDIDLASPTIFISADARAAIADGTAKRLICLDAPERSRKFRSACLTSAEWQKTVARVQEVKRRKITGGIVGGLLPNPWR